MCEGGSPYIVPLCFGYEESNLYFHSAGVGRTQEALRKNESVGFEISVDHKISISGGHCHWEMMYRCVIGFDRASFVEDLAKSAGALTP